MRSTGFLLAALAVGIVVGGSILPQLSSAVVMSSEGPSARLYSSPRASIAASGDNVYVSWWDNRTAGNNEIFFARSTDNGQTFGEAVNLSNSTGASADNQITAENNNVYVVWWDNKTGNWEVYSRSSTDGGETFGEPVMLQSIGNSTFKLAAPQPNVTSVDTVLAASGNNEYVVWWDDKTGNWEVLFARSTDNGVTFGDTVNISNSSDLRSIGARIAAEGNYVYISWIEINPANGQKDVFVRTSSDEGQTFGEPIMLTTANSTTTLSSGAPG
ncbi:MAG TPA: sialidase family protein [Nitrososphaeraceae archaeon]|nr:sialidase family protein [Nitrososphaeraceae archaeon]